MRSKFSGIGVCGDDLTLIPRRGQHTVIQDIAGMLQMSCGMVKTTDVQQFKSVSAPSAPGYDLSVAVWPDGSRATLDSRGLLHLQSSDPQIPQATLVLDHQQVSIWASDGRRMGLEYYIDQKVNRVDAARLIHDVVTRFVQRIRSQAAEPR